MKISAIQSQLSNSKSRSSNSTTSIGYLKDSPADSFSKGNNVSFKGWEGAKTGAIIGAITGTIAIIVTGGAAAPIIGPILAGASLGHVKEEIKKASKKIK